MIGNHLRSLVNRPKLSVQPDFCTIQEAGDSTIARWEESVEEAAATRSHHSQASSDDLEDESRSEITIRDSSREDEAASLSMLSTRSETSASENDWGGSTPTGKLTPLSRSTSTTTSSIHCGDTTSPGDRSDQDVSMVSHIPLHSDTNSFEFDSHASQAAPVFSLPVAWEDFVAGAPKIDGLSSASVGTRCKTAVDPAPYVDRNDKFEVWTDQVSPSSAMTSRDAGIATSYTPSRHESATIGSLLQILDAQSDEHATGGADSSWAWDDISGDYDFSALPKKHPEQALLHQGQGRAQRKASRLSAVSKGFDHLATTFTVNQRDRPNRSQTPNPTPGRSKRFTSLFSKSTSDLNMLQAKSETGLRDLGPPLLNLPHDHSRPLFGPEDSLHLHTDISASSSGRLDAQVSDVLAGEEPLNQCSTPPILPGQRTVVAGATSQVAVNHHRISDSQRMTVTVVTQLEVRGIDGVWRSAS